MSVQSYETETKLPAKGKGPYSWTMEQSWWLGDASLVTHTSERNKEDFAKCSSSSSVLKGEKMPFNFTLSGWDLRDVAPWKLNGKIWILAHCSATASWYSLAQSGSSGEAIPLPMSLSNETFLISTQCQQCKALLLQRKSCAVLYRENASAFWLSHHKKKKHLLWCEIVPECT